MAEAPTVQEVLDAAERWERGVLQNLPPTVLPMPSPHGEPRTLGVPEPIYPDQVVRLTSRQWVRDGSSPLPNGPSKQRQKPYHEVPGVHLGDVLSWMLCTEGKWEPAARRILDLTLRRVGPLLIGAFGAKHCRDGERWNDYPVASREVVLEAVAVLGIVLETLNCRKEVYMENPAYRVGQILSLADTLHRDYCVVVRKGQMPTSLIGTSLMRRALDSPAAAIADLGERLMEYVRWAKTVQLPPNNGGADDDKDHKSRRIAVHEARKTLRRYQSVAARLGATDLPNECDDLMKAQILLGFLATPPDESSPDNPEDDDQ